MRFIRMMKRIKWIREKCGRVIPPLFFACRKVFRLNGLAPAGAAVGCEHYLWHAPQAYIAKIQKRPAMGLFGSQDA